MQANWYSSREDQPILAIIAHDTERPNDNSNSIAYLQRGGALDNGSDRKVSIHVLIAENGDSYQMVSDQQAANHAGYGTLTVNGRTYKNAKGFYNLNTCTLGFELERTKGTTKPYPEAQLLSAGYWINLWRDRHGANLALYRHAEVDPTRRSDPTGLTIATLEDYAKKAARLMAEVPTPEKPLQYRMLVPQVVYTARLLGSRFASDAKGKPFVIDSGVEVPIGDITGDWAWIATGIGFVPVNTIKKVI